MLNHCFSAYVKPYEPRINMNKQPHQPPCSSADPFLPEVVVRRCQRLSVAQGMLLWTCARHREIFGKNIRNSIGVHQKSLGKSRENPWTFGESRENMGKIHENSENPGKIWGKSMKIRVWKGDEATKMGLQASSSHRHRMEIDDLTTKQ